VTGVRDFNGNPLATSPSAMGIITRLAFERLKEQGVEVDALLRNSGLTQQRVEDPSYRLAVKDQIRFLELAAVSLKDEYLGFHLAKTFDVRMGGLFYYVLASSETLNEALHRAARFSAIVNEGIKLNLRERGHIAIDLAYAGVPRHSDLHQIEFSMVAIMRICRHLTGLQLRASRVSFTHRRSGAGVTQFKTFFGSEVVFGAVVDELALPTAVKEMAVISADPYLNTMLMRYCEQALANRSTNQRTFESSVENAIAVLLPHGQARAGQIARKLGVSRRTLARRLSSEGVTFAGVLQHLKLGLAKRHLADDTLSISEIAWLLGYQDVSAFTNAFKRWTGRPPRAMRKEVDQGL
jgi:AraC-like DNA-binding protein